MSWVNRRVLVTGAAGFIGSHLCEALLELGADVTAMLRYSSRSDWGNLELLSPEARATLRVVSGNVEDADFMLAEVRGKQVVFHLAALIGIPYSYAAPRSYVRTNIEGTLNVLEAARACGTPRVVHTSTSETYGTARYSPMDEAHPLHAQSPYAATKIGADKLAEGYHRAFDLPVVTVRPFNTYGPRQSARAIVPTVISQALFRAAIRLGALHPVRDLTYVRDIVAGFIALADCDGAVGETVNLGSGCGISVGDLATRILRLMNCDKPIILDAVRLRPDASEVLSLICDAGKSEQLAAWRPRWALDDGLRACIAFAEKHPNMFKPDRYAT